MPINIKDSIESSTIKGSLNGNASTATTLQTTRSINGTNFNGSANITTANWGTARTLTIGNSGKSVNGSGNVSWSTSEILGQGTITTGDWNSANTMGVYEVGDFSGSNGPSGAYKWGGLLTLRRGNVTNQVYLSHSNNEMWIRGGWNGTWNGSWSRVYTSTHPQTTITGNAGTATKLQTPRTINGTSFDGSGNITTANWGTARNITVGNTTKSVNGSGNVSWTLSEIGAASSSHNHTTLTSVSSIKFANATISNTGATDTLQINGTTNGVGALKLGSGGCRIYGMSSSARLYVEGGIYTNSTIEGGSSAIFNGACYPGRSQQAGWDCGLKDRRWYTVYCVGVSQSSDRSFKKDIKYIENDIPSMPLSKNKNNKVSPTKFKDFIANELKIATYKYKREFKEYDEDGNVISVKELPNEEIDSQIGFIAQDIRNTDVGSMFVYGEDGNMNYSPSGFTTVVAKALQEEIKSRDIIIQDMQSQIDELNEKINLLMTKL